MWESKKIFPLWLALFSPVKTRILSYSIWGPSKQAGVNAQFTHTVQRLARGGNHCCSSEHTGVAECWHFMPWQCALTLSEHCFSLFFFHKFRWNRLTFWFLSLNRKKLGAHTATWHVQNVTTDYMSALSCHMFSLTGSLVRAEETKCHSLKGEKAIVRTYLYKVTDELVHVSIGQEETYIMDRYNGITLVLPLVRLGAVFCKYT